MNFKIAVIKCLIDYKNFNGRSKRAEFWWFALFGLMVSIITLLIEGRIKMIWPSSNQVALIFEATYFELLMSTLFKSLARAFFGK